MQVFYGVPVQGAAAAPAIVSALDLASQRDECDVLIVARGGGSLEDLWAFNEEIVAQAIHACRIPVVSAVGHEIDVTVADLVADVRALTPSEAAELVVPNRTEVHAELLRLEQHLAQALRSQAAGARARLNLLASRRVITRPLERLHDLARHIDELELRSRRAIGNRLMLARQVLATAGGRLISPDQRPYEAGVLCRSGAASLFL